MKSKAYNFFVHLIVYNDLKKKLFFILYIFSFKNEEKARKL